MSDAAAVYEVPDRPSGVVTTRAARADAVAQARASARLEGGDLTPEAEVLAERYVAGELTSKQWAEETIRLFR